MRAHWYTFPMTAKLVYVKKTDKKLVKKLARDLKPALDSLAKK
jgi:hypothetical protein